MLKSFLYSFKNQFNEVFKDRVGAIASMITYIPVLMVSNKIYPKIKNKNKKIIYFSPLV